MSYTEQFDTTSFGNATQFYRNE